MTDAVCLREIARARSGDKANQLNVGVIADTEQAYERLDEQLSAERVQQHFEGIIEGDVIRYELPNIHGFNFVGSNALGGGGQRSIRYDTQGKTYAAALLLLELPPWQRESQGD